MSVSFNPFKTKVELEAGNSKGFVYRVSVSYQQSLKEWFVLQHYTGFERLFKFLKKTEEYKQILSRRCLQKMPKKGIMSFMKNNQDYNNAVLAITDIVFSEPKLLNVDEVQVFFAITRHISKVDMAY